LQTTWQSPSGAVRLTEGMVLDVEGRLLPQRLLVRGVECLEGTANVCVRFNPRAGLNGQTFEANRRNGALVCSHGGLALALQTAPELEVMPGRDVEVVLHQGRRLTLALAVADREPLVLVSPDEAFELLEDTDRSWRSWTSRI